MFHSGENRVDETGLFGALLFFFLFLAGLLLFLFKSDERVANKCLFGPLVFLPFMPASNFLPLFHGGEGPVGEQHPFGALVFVPWFESDRDWLGLCFPGSLFFPLFHGGEGPVAEKHPFGGLVFLSWSESDDPFAERYLFNAHSLFFALTRHPPADRLY